MNPEKLLITDFLEQSKAQLVIDVRSPGEYNHAHMPGAVNIPLFTDEERKVVGTAYKQESREKAIKHGLDFFGPKMKNIVEEVERLLSKNQGSRTVFLYCWRGGMRSGAIAWLLNLYGFRVYLLAGGYKSFRNHVLKTFSFPFSLKVIGGYTGSGKTELLHELQKRGEVIVDLEGLAIHKGSAFGNIDSPKQPTQEMFENLLAMDLLKLRQEKTVWVEDESQRIGNVNIPGEFWDQLRHSPLYFLDIPFEERLTHICEEYGQYKKEDLQLRIERISKRLGGLETKHALQYLEENNINECFRILLKYYDKLYLKGLHNRKDLASLLTQINCEKVCAANAQLLTPNPVGI